MTDAVVGRSNGIYWVIADFGSLHWPCHFLLSKRCVKMEVDDRQKWMMLTRCQPLSVSRITTWSALWMSVRRQRDWWSLNEQFFLILWSCHEKCMALCAELGETAALCSSHLIRDIQRMHSQKWTQCTQIHTFTKKQQFKSSASLWGTNLPD